MPSYLIVYYLLQLYHLTHKEDGTRGVLADGVDEGVVEGEIGHRSHSAVDANPCRHTCCLCAILIYMDGHLVGDEDV